jgi:hypothetical protein
VRLGGLRRTRRGLPTTWLLLRPNRPLHPSGEHGRWDDARIGRRPPRDSPPTTVGVATAAVGTALVPSAGARPFGFLPRSCPENELTEIGLGRPSVRTAGPAADPCGVSAVSGWPNDGLTSPILVRNLGAPRRRGGVPGCSAPAFGGRLPRVGLPGRLVSRETCGEKREIVTSDYTAVEIPIGGQHRIMSLVGDG